MSARNFILKRFCMHVYMCTYVCMRSFIFQRIFVDDVRCTDEMKNEAASENVFFIEL
jgi:hypothetical protein